jgi:chromosome segregation ATPase
MCLPFAAARFVNIQRELREMTNEEFERAIDFILKSQARAEARVERNEEQLSRNEEQLSRLAEQVSQLAQQGADFQQRLDFIATAHASLEDAHATLVRVLTQHIETQDRIDKSLRETDVRQARFSASLGESLRASDESLRKAMAALATRQERTEATVDRLSHKVEALVKVVEEERNRGR